MVRRSCWARRCCMLGAGGLGSPAALYLAAAGVGTLGIVDMDEVDASNLQRQILHNVDRIGDRKVDSAKKTLTLLNPDVNVVAYDTRLSADNVLDIIDGYDVIIDGADNFPSRYLLNDASLKKRIPVVHGSIFRFEGQATVFNPYVGPVLPLHDPRAAAGRTGPQLRRGRRARRAARHHRVDPGARGDQDHSRHRRHAAGSAAGVRLARAELPNAEGPPRPRLPGMLDRSRRHRHRRVRRTLHAAPALGPRHSVMAANWPVGHARDGGIDRIPLPVSGGGLSLCGKHAVGPDPQGALDRAGATTLVCLNERDELEARYPLYVEWLRTQSGERVVWFPIPDLHMPPLVETTDLLHALAERIRRGEHLLVHCGAGIGPRGPRPCAS